jgi:hypothetical protein
MTARPALAFLTAAVESIHPTVHLACVKKIRLPVFSYYLLGKNMSRKNRLVFMSYKPVSENALPWHI